MQLVYTGADQQDAMDAIRRARYLDLVDVSLPTLELADYDALYCQAERYKQGLSKIMVPENCPYTALSRTFRAPAESVMEL